MHPFVALMRRYCIDYTNSHDQSVCDDIMEPDYVVHISGWDLPRDESYKPAVADLFERAPGLGLVVHELVLNGDRLSMRFSEHGAFTGGNGPATACWGGIGLYRWNGHRLTENWVEQDHLSMQEQLAHGAPNQLEPPHLDPWVTTEPVPLDRAAEAVVQAWLELGDLSDADRVHIDDTPPGTRWLAPVEPATITIDDLFSAGSRVPFHITIDGAYLGHIPDVPDENVGEAVKLSVAGIADVDGDRIASLRAFTSRSAVRAALTGASPI